MPGHNRQAIAPAFQKVHLPTQRSPSSPLPRRVTSFAFFIYKKTNPKKNPKKILSITNFFSDETHGNNFFGFRTQNKSGVTTKNNTQGDKEYWLKNAAAKGKKFLSTEKNPVFFFFDRKVPGLKTRAGPAHSASWWCPFRLPRV